MFSYSDPIIVLAGPTASGKSDIGIRLAKDIGGYIINGDSRQVYKELNIGVAKPVPDSILEDNTWVIDGINHYLFDFVDPKDNFTIYEYQGLVRKVLETNKGNGKVPIIVGGSGLYIDSVIFNYDLDENNVLNNSLHSLSLIELQRLSKSYSIELNNSDFNNKHRLIRLIQRDGRKSTKSESLNHIYFVIDIDKECLSERISKRIDCMFRSGLVEENERLLSLGYSYEDKGLKSIGYQEFDGYFTNNKSLEAVKEDIYLNTLRYAKRQRTWFRRNKNAIWISDYNKVLELASNFISKE